MRRWAKRCAPGAAAPGFVLPRCQKGGTSRREHEARPAIPTLRQECFRPTCRLKHDLTPSCDTEDEALRPVHSKGRQNCPAGPCNSHDALPAGRRYPSQSKKARLEWQRYSSSHPPMWRDARASDSTLASKRNRYFHRKMVQVLPTEHMLSERPGVDLLVRSPGTPGLTSLRVSRRGWLTGKRAANASVPRSQPTSKT